MADGTVLSLLTDDQEPPAEVVHKLDPSLRAKVHVFRPRLSLSLNTMLLSRVTISDVGKLKVRPWSSKTCAIRKGSLRDTLLIWCYSFTPGLREGQNICYAQYPHPVTNANDVGHRWNRLTMLQYSSIKLDSEECEALPLKNERPFWFSKVRSYSA